MFILTQACIISPELPFNLSKGTGNPRLKAVQEHALCVKIRA